MKRLYALLAALVLLATMVTPAAAATTFFLDNFDAGLGKWDSIVTTGNGYVASAAATTCASKGLTNKCLFTKTGVASGAGEAYVKELMPGDVYGGGFITDITASWHTNISPQVDNGSTVHLFSARDYFTDSLAIAIVYDPIGTTGGRVRAKCQKADGTYAYTSWLTVPVNQSFQLVAQFIQGTSGLCKVMVGTMSGIWEASLTIDNHGTTADYVRLGMVSTPTGIQVAAYTDDFVVRGMNDTIDLLNQDDFENGLDFQWEPNWNGTAGVDGGQQPYVDNCSWGSKCLYLTTLPDLYTPSLSVIGYDVYWWAGGSPKGGAGAQWTQTINFNMNFSPQNAVDILTFYDHGVPAYRVQYYQGSVGHYFFRAACLDNDSNQWATGWMEATSQPVALEANWRVGDQYAFGYCDLTLNDGSGVRNSYFYLENSNWSHMDYITLGLLDVPPGLFQSTMVVNDYTIWSYRP